MCAKDSKNPILANEIAEITNFTQKLPPTVTVKWGIGDDPSLDDKVKVTVLASGFDMTIRENENKKGPIEFPDNHGTTVTPEKRVETRRSPRRRSRRSTDATR